MPISTPISQGKALIQKSAVNGPWIYTFTVDGEMQQAATGVASAALCLDAIKPLIAAMTGQLVRVAINVVTE